MSTFRLAVERALTGVGPFPRSIAESILEIAYLTMAVDEHLRDEEIEAFSVIAATMLQGRAASNEPLDDQALRSFLDRFGEDLTKETFEPRLEAAVAKLDGNHEAKLASYRVACLMAMSDMDAADQEFEFDLQLIATLGIDQDEADAIMDEVNGALTPLDAN